MTFFTLACGYLMQLLVSLCVFQISVSGSSIFLIKKVYSDSAFRGNYLFLAADEEGSTKTICKARETWRTWVGLSSRYMHMFSLKFFNWYIFFKCTLHKYTYQSWSPSTPWRTGHQGRGLDVAAWNSDTWCMANTQSSGYDSWHHPPSMAQWKAWCNLKATISNTMDTSSSLY